MVALNVKLVFVPLRRLATTVPPTAVNEGAVGVVGAVVSTTRTVGYDE